MTATMQLSSIPGVNGPDPTTFEQFWPYYVSQHLHPMTRHLHAWGPSLAILLGAGGAAAGVLWLVPTAVALGYGTSWFSHFVIEQNKPASWGRPAWSFRGDMRLIRRYFTGRLADDVRGVRTALGLRPEQRTLADAR